MAAYAHSAEVSLRLIVGAREFALSHVESDCVVVGEECEPIAAQEAVLSIQVDDYSSQQPIRMLNDIQGNGSIVSYRAAVAIEEATPATA
jgi:hypothetical protein